MIEQAKATNPKEAIGSTKPYTSMVPSAFVYGVGLAFVEGGCKYRAHNYRVAGVRVSTYINAAKRHLDVFWEGEDIDPQSGIHHLLKAGACMAVVFDSLVVIGNATDDRPPAYPAGWMKYFEDATVQLLARYPEPKPPHTEIEERALLQTQESELHAPARILVQDLTNEHRGARFRRHPFVGVLGFEEATSYWYLACDRTSLYPGTRSYLLPEHVLELVPE